MDDSDVPKMKKPKKWEFKLPERFQNLENPDHPDYSPEGPGLPERPHKRIKEKFRLELERLEADLNAKGDSLYRSKLQQMQPDQPDGQGGYGQPAGYGQGGYGPPGGYGQPSFYGQPSYSQNPFGWGGGFPPAQRTGPPGWGGPQTPTQDRIEMERSMMESSDATGFREFANIKHGPPGNDPFTKDDFSLDNNNAGVEDGDRFTEESFKNQDHSDENEFEDGNEPTRFHLDDLADGQNSTVEYLEGGKEEFGEEEEEFERGPMYSGGAFPYSDDFGQSSHELTGGSAEGEMLTNTTEGHLAMDSNITEVENSTPQTELEPLRPRKQLKESFMRENEELEKMLNAKGESMYRRAGDPIPEHLMANQPQQQGYGQRGGYPERRIQTADELRAQMALQKIARAALKAQAMRGKRKGTPVIFI